MTSVQSVHTKMAKEIFLSLFFFCSFFFQNMSFGTPGKSGSKQIPWLHSK